MTTKKSGATIAPQEKKSNDVKKLAEVKKAEKRIDEILQPSAKGRIKKLETLNILAEKHAKISDKHDELTRFVASNDTNANMKFNAENGYTFTISNPVIVSKILLIIEEELSDLLANAENEVLTFQI